MPHRFPATVAALVLAALLAGCHTAKVLIPPNLRPPSENTGDALKLAQQQLLQATPCCSSFADFSYRSMLPWQPEKFTLGSSSMVANLNGTHSYFLAFRLPADVKLPYQVAMKSELNGRWLHASYLFAPTVVLLDEGFQPIRSVDIGLCEHMGWSDETTGAFGSVSVDEPQARYLLVYSSADQQSGKTYWEQSPASITTTTATLKMNPTGSFSIPHGPDGSLWVGMMNKTYKKTIDNAICKKAEKGDGVLNTLRTALPLPWINSSNNSGSKTNHASSP
ncbi:MalM family protein [Rhodanobacter sp. OK091]|uniref:MalM family protein n=1 Tax=Rhodanobacter sp. OK091 TaxID=1881037 RepID=UPI0009235549|nr:MalM family protein [Rhodanobacter sp. OK091]SHM04715.1 Maltose operon substrate-binding protein precursor (MalM) [Rhodanobacter sp. OK091]